MQSFSGLPYTSVHEVEGFERRGTSFRSSEPYGIGAIFQENKTDERDESLRFIVLLRLEKQVYAIFTSTKQVPQVPSPAQLPVAYG